MKVVMDSDCLVKLTKAGAKEAVAMAMEVYIPDLVKRETVDEVKGKGYQDAIIIEENIKKKFLRIVKSREDNSLSIPVTKGEGEVVSLYLKGSYDVIASDDRKFLKKIEAANIPYLTPTACLVYLYKSGKNNKAEVLKMLEALKPLISSEEYVMSKFYLEEKR